MRGGTPGILRDPDLRIRAHSGSPLCRARRSAAVRGSQVPRGGPRGKALRHERAAGRLGACWSPRGHSDAGVPPAPEPHTELRRNHLRRWTAHPRNPLLGPRQLRRRNALPDLYPCPPPRMSRGSAALLPTKAPGSVRTAVNPSAPIHVASRCDSICALGTGSFRSTATAQRTPQPSDWSLRRRSV